MDIKITKKYNTWKLYELPRGSFFRKFEKIEEANIYMKVNEKRTQTANAYNVTTGLFEAFRDNEYVIKLKVIRMEVEEV
jgi:hypothetical protein